MIIFQDVAYLIHYHILQPPLLQESIDTISSEIYNRLPNCAITTPGLMMAWVGYDF
jgi:hypothetical protein